MSVSPAESQQTEQAVGGRAVGGADGSVDSHCCTAPLQRIHLKEISPKSDRNLPEDVRSGTAQCSKQ